MLPLVEQGWQADDCKGGGGEYLHLANAHTAVGNKKKETSVFSETSIQMLTILHLLPTTVGICEEC